jgi:RNA polymerase sigma factor for flagellar operon FliA
VAAAADREAARKTADPSAANGDSAQVLEDIAEILSGVATVHITSIEGAWEIPDDRFKAPDEEAQDTQGRTRVRTAMAGLPEKERRLMELYYFADMNLEDAGAKLGLSKSWASRLHARAVNYLREALGEVDS